MSEEAKKLRCPCCGNTIGKDRVQASAPLPAVEGWVNINGTDYHESVVRAVERAHGIRSDA